MSHGRVRFLMESDVEIISPEASLEQAARKMRETDCGFLPVGEPGSRPIGVITDRDIVIRAIADGASMSASRVRDFMTAQVCCCADSDTLDEAAEIMNERDVSRLVVLDNEGDVCGVLTFGHIIRNHNNARELGQFVMQAASGQTSTGGHA